MGRDLCAVVGAAEDPHLRRGLALGMRARSCRERVLVAQRLAREPSYHVHDVGRELVGPAVGLRVQREGRAAIRARRPAEARSMRPGAMASSTRNCSATFSGA